MGIRYRPFEIGESLMELLEPMRDDSPVAKFLRQNGGPGVHHITYEVDDLDKPSRNWNGGADGLPTAIRMLPGLPSKVRFGAKLSCIPGTPLAY
jgi:hypothetical protein